MILLIGAGEAGHARVVHEAIGKLLGPQEGSRIAEHAADVAALAVRGKNVASVG
jgi:hypothetical protein